MTATVQEPLLAEHRRNVLTITGLGGGDVGQLPDASHKAGGGYHCGVQDIINLGKYPTGDYSTRQTRDRVGGNTCMAEDVGDDWPHGGRPAWLRFNNALVAAMIAKDPALVALREVNFSPDGTACRRYDALHPEQGIIASTDTVYMHTHLGWWRNMAGTAALAQSLRRIEQLMQAAVTGTVAAPGPKRETQPMIIAQDSTTKQVYLCWVDGKWGSIPIDTPVERLGDLAYLAGQAGVTVATGKAPEFTGPGGVLRLSWSAAVFGPVVKPAPASAGNALTGDLTVTGTLHVNEG